VVCKLIFIAGKSYNWANLLVFVLFAYLLTTIAKTRKENSVVRFHDIAHNMMVLSLVIVGFLYNLVLKTNV
jgi:hypothetical protein